MTVVGGWGEREGERERESSIGDIVIIQTHNVNTSILGQKFTIHILGYTIQAIPYMNFVIFYKIVMVG